MIYLGIDPGVSGGVAWILEHKSRGTRRVHVEKMPATVHDLRTLIDQTRCLSRQRFAMIEKVSTLPRPTGNKTNFVFGKNFGEILGVLAAFNVPYDLVSASTWQQFFKLRKQKVKLFSAEHKNILKAKAQQLFPTLNITLATADALLLAEYCRQKVGDYIDGNGNSKQ